MSDETLPSIATILQSTDRLSAPDASATVVRIGEKFAVKYGAGVSLLEAQNMDYVARHSDVPVPKLYGTMTEESTGRNFIVMDMVQGQTLAQAWPSLTSSERRDVVGQIQEALSNLRGIPSDGYIGSIARQTCADGVFYNPNDPCNPSLCGPFDTEDAMKEGILQKLASSEPRAYVTFLRTLFAATLQGNHQIFFTHGDLQPKNIMVEATTNAASGMTTRKIKIIDWEISGWYPEYWEFCNATFSGRFQPGWLETVQSIMPSYPQEHLMMQLIRCMLFC